ncbi:MAG TPA: hypothetical protein VI685_19795 [Candidatus Angelobacter sp.]
MDFRKAVVAPGATPGSLVLTVTGDKPREARGGAPVKLQPLSYEVQPEYWKVEVLWDTANANVPAIAPFSVSISLDGIRGTKGIEVVGQSRSQKISI